MTDIFKLIFEHDLRLDQLRERQLDRDKQEVSGSIEDFLKPDPTYSKFYLTGTRLGEENRFGLNQLEKYKELLNKFAEALSEYNVFRDEEQGDLIQFIQNEKLGAPFILTKETENRWVDLDLDLDHQSNVGHKKEGIAEVLEAGDLVLYKENAHDGFDLHLFSKKNIYRNFFHQLKPLVTESFRFFSINGKKIRSERKFYFETWTLQRPPHGVEEVFSETVL
ncbi:hypothetical protein [Rhodohalobacter halophilus]|uniref:hypothetical protein n=1 Tax=Rhodohalobacter halophilus TaxID=1812810 RepID=UPI00083F69DF|nr:hypothetical protein [Rhodohalobacter halophilus]